MAEGRNSKPVQTPGAATVLTEETPKTDLSQNNPTSPPAGEGSQTADSSQQQAGAMGHPVASNTAGIAGGSGETSAPAPTVTLTQEQFETLMGRLEAAEAKIENREQAEIVPKVELPRAAEVDVSKLKSPVLTQDGWLVPEIYGSNPNNK